jgi:hypothetical protein
MQAGKGGKQAVCGVLPVRVFGYQGGKSVRKDKT